MTTDRLPTPVDSANRARLAENIRRVLADHSSAGMLTFIAPREDWYEVVCALLDTRSETESRDAEDAERYRWFRDECAHDRRYDILDAADGVPDMIDHHIDKGRCGL